MTYKENKLGKNILVVNERNVIYLNFFSQNLVTEITMALKIFKLI